MADIRGVTGGIGSGKTYIIVDEIVKLRNTEDGKNREIFTNIRGIDASLNCQELPDPWHSAPQNALIIIDEIQDFECFTRAYSNKMHPDALPLAKIRHKNHDVWFTTQSWKPISTFVQGLVNDHWHIFAVGKKKSRVYKWKEAQVKISKASKQQAYYDDVYALKDEIHSLYKSVEDGAKVSRSYHRNINLISFLVGLGIILAIGFAVAYFTGSYAKGKTDTLEQEKSENTNGEKIDVLNKDGQKTVDAKQYSAEVDEKIRTCQEQFQWTFEQCRGVYDKEYTEARNKELEQATRNNMDQVVVDYYDPAKPYDVKYTPKFEPRDFPRFKNAVVFNGKCTPYSQQGTVMHEVSSKDCFRLANGDRPFDYFAEQKPSVQPTSPTSDENYKKAYLENLARIDAERYSKAQDAVVLAEQIPLGAPIPKDITGANSL